ncbi:MAG: vanadium-dependent haloperoxidase [Bacteroidota bacterium]|nr:vanadium-dependent haloperoxidase [Bacteroidota bacterium]
MKKKLTLYGSTLIVLFAMYACDKKELDQITDFGELKRANNGMIKSYNNATVLKWDEALSMAIDNKMPAPAESRIYAMVTLAMHDALNNVVPKYETYALDNSWNDGKEVSKKTIYSVADAAVAQAAHDVLVALYPNSKQNADDLLASGLSEIEDTELKDSGIQIGKDAAQAILAKRQNDVLPKFETYPQGTEPGQYRSTMPFKFATPAWPANAVYAPSWGDTDPFGILSGDQFRPEPPYDINSPEYTADYNEVKSFGSNASTIRTQDQTNMGVFLTDNMPSMMNRVARVMAVQENLNGWETARLLALIQMTAADALISTFDGIYYYSFWRPITAIQEGDNDGNNDTARDAAWVPLQSARATPPLPSYPSSYAAAGSAGAEVFKMYFGKDDISFTVGSYSLPNTERSYASFSQLAEEMAVSRIYAGHSFRNDNVQGEKMGRELARFVYDNNLSELK